MFRLQSPAFSDNGPIPRAHTCDGADLSPPLTWSGAPPETREYALIMDDPDAPGRTWVHWVLYRIPAGTTALPPGIPTDRELTHPIAARQGMNDSHSTGWAGPCPPPGAPHGYVFTLYALSAPIELPPGATKAVLLESMKRVVIGQAVLRGRYGRKAG
jgi:Raf kinase inhibitor-like YbhB/YbcL family protein